MSLAAIGAGVAGILRDSASFVWRHRGLFAVTYAVTLVVTVLLYPYDRQLLAQLQEASTGLDGLAGRISTIGRFESSSLAAAVMLFLLGLLGKRDRLKRAAVACLLAGIIGGLGVTLLRPTFGRARPGATVAPGFYWFEPEEQMHSMPSGHVMSNAASVAAVATVLPVLAPVAALYAAGITWSRLQLNRHHPTDVIWGLVLGGSVGIAVGAPPRDRGSAPRPGGSTDLPHQSLPEAPRSGRSWVDRQSGN